MDILIAVSGISCKEMTLCQWLGNKQHHLIKLPGQNKTLHAHNYKR